MEKMISICGYRINYRHILIMIFAGFLHTNISAAPPVWIVHPEKSTLSFTATQNNAPVKGYFKKFTTDITFDEQHLSESRIKVTIDTNSVSTTYPELTSTLLSSDWFATKQFPIAIFEAQTIERLGLHQYKAIGTLTLRDKSSPVTLTFTATLPTPQTATVEGSATLLRNVFGVGQGEWSSTAEIKDDVKINFVLSATKSN